LVRQASALPAAFRHLHLDAASPRRGRRVRDRLQTRPGGFTCLGRSRWKSRQRSAAISKVLQGAGPSMSAQAGVFYFDSRPVNLELVAAMGRSLDAFGPDRASQHVAPGLAMVHRALHITPEDRHELQPLISTRQSVLTWDGRLDNRHDLLSQLWHDLDDDDESDAALALCVYEKWGIDGFSKLVGDWSLVIWDEEKQ